MNTVIGDNETGFKGTGDTHCRMEGWEFILGGGGLYNNLDYSFTAGNEDGTFAYPATQPGGGTLALRRQLRILKEFIDSFDFVRMKPDNSAIREVRGKSSSPRTRALVEPGKQYAIYVFGGPEVNLVLELPAGNYRVEWINVLTGAVDRHERLNHAGGPTGLKSPLFQDDVALRVVREKTDAASAENLNAESPYAAGCHGPPNDPLFFPIAVWLQHPRNGAAYKEAGISS